MAVEFPSAKSIRKEEEQEFEMGICTGGFAVAAVDNRIKSVAL